MACQTSDFPSWFHGALSRTEAEVLLDRFGSFDGLFLVRESTRDSNGYVLSICYGGDKYHFQICSEQKDDANFLRLDTESKSGPKFTCLDGVFHYLLNSPTVLPCPLTQWVSNNETAQADNAVSLHTQPSKPPSCIALF